MTIDLYNLAIEAGMSEQEFIGEVRRLYARNLSAVLKENTGKMLVHIVNFTDHDLEIIARRVPAKNLSTVN